MPHESKLSIETVDNLISIAVNGIPEGITSISIAEHLSTIKIRVCGEGYEAAIPGEQLRTLWELQADLYRLAAFALHGSADMRALSQGERQQFELKVKVEKGSFVSNIVTSDFWSALFVNAVGKMSGMEIGLTISGCTLIICGKLMWDRYNQRLEILAKENTQQKQAEALVKVVEAFTATEQNKVKSCIEKTGNVISTTAERFAKRGHKISSLEVAGATYNKQGIENLKERSKKRNLINSVELIDPPTVEKIKT